MLATHGKFALIALAIFSCNCSPAVELGGECESQFDCVEGAGCLNSTLDANGECAVDGVKVCVQFCDSNADCDEGFVCETECSGACQPAE